MASLDEFMNTPSSTILKHVLAKQVIVRGGALMATHLLSWAYPKWFMNQIPKKVSMSPTATAGGGGDHGGEEAEEQGIPKEMVRDSLTAFLDPLQVVVEAARLGIDVGVAVGLQAVRVSVGNFPSPAHVMIFCDSRYQRTCPVGWRWIFSCMPLENTAVEVLSSTVIGGFREWLAVSLVEKSRMVLQGLAHDSILYHATGVHISPFKVSVASAGVRLVVGVGCRLVAEWAISRIGHRYTGFGILHDVFVTSVTQFTTAMIELYLVAVIMNPMVVLRISGKWEKYCDGRISPFAQGESPMKPVPISSVLEMNTWSSNVHSQIHALVFTPNLELSHNTRIKRLRLFNRLNEYRNHVYCGRLARSNSIKEKKYDIKADTLTVEDLQQPGPTVEGVRPEDSGCCLTCVTAYQTVHCQVGMPIIRVSCGHYFCSQKCLDEAPPDMLCRYCSEYIMHPPSTVERQAQNAEWLVVLDRIDASLAREGMVIPVRLQMATWQIAAGYAIRQGLIQPEHCWFLGVDWECSGLNPYRTPWVGIFWQYGSVWDFLPTDQTVEVGAGHY